MLQQRTKRRDLLDSLLTTLRDKRISLAILFSIIINVINIIIVISIPGMVAQWLERPPHEQEVVGSNPGRVIPKTYNNGTVCLLAIGAQHIRLEKGSNNILCYAGPAGRAVS